MRAANRVVEPPIRVAFAVAAGVLALAMPDPAPAAEAGAITTAVATDVAPEDDVIGPLDKLSIKVFKVPDLSSDQVVVDATGDIQMPLIGEVRAGRKRHPKR